MGHVTRLRIGLADRAGALAQAATVIGLHGGNILSIDVHRSDGPSAVDDLVVEFPDEPDLPEIERDLATDARTVVLDHGTTEPGDPVIAGIQMLGQLLSRTRADPAGALAEAATCVSRSTSAWVTDEAGAAGFDEGRRALGEGHPFMGRSADLPPALMPDPPGEMWLAAVPEPAPRGSAPAETPRRVVFLARAGQAPFTWTELERVEAVMELQRRLLQVDAPDLT